MNGTYMFMKLSSFFLQFKPFVGFMPFLFKIICTQGLGEINTKVIEKTNDH